MLDDLTCLEAEYQATKRKTSADRTIQVGKGTGLKLRDVVSGKA